MAAKQFHDLGRRFFPLPLEFVVLLLHREHQLDHFLPRGVDQTADNLKSTARRSHRRERTKDYRDPPEDLGGPEREEIRRSRTDTDRVELHRRFSSCPRPCAMRSRAFVIETATGVPPLRPRFVMYGTRPCPRSCSFESAADTNPTGTPMMRAGPASPSSTRRTSSSSAVGA